MSSFRAESFTQSCVNAVECNFEGQFAVLTERGVQVFEPKFDRGGALFLLSKWAKVVGWRQDVEKDKRGATRASESGRLQPWGIGPQNRDRAADSTLSMHMSWSPCGFHRGEGSYLTVGLSDGSAFLMGLTEDCEVNIHRCRAHRAIFELSGMCIAYEIAVGSGGGSATAGDVGSIRATTVWYPRRVTLPTAKATDTSSCLVMVSANQSSVTIWSFMKPLSFASAAASVIPAKVVLHSRHVSQPLLPPGEAFTSLAILPSVGMDTDVDINSLRFDLACGLASGAVLLVSVQPRAPTETLAKGSTGAFSFQVSPRGPRQLLPCPVAGLRPFGVGSFRLAVFGGDRLSFVDLAPSVDSNARVANMDPSLLHDTLITGMAVMSRDPKCDAIVVSVSAYGEAQVSAAKPDLSTARLAPLATLSGRRFIGVCNDKLDLLVCTARIEVQESGLLVGQATLLDLYTSPALGQDWIRQDLSKILVKIALLTPCTEDLCLTPLGLTYLLGVGGDWTNLEALVGGILAAGTEATQEISKLPIGDQGAALPAAVAVQSSSATLAPGHRRMKRLWQTVHHLVHVVHTASGTRITSPLLQGEMSSLRQKIQVATIAESAARVLEQTATRPAILQSELLSLTLMAQLLQNYGTAVVFRRPSHSELHAGGEGSPAEMTSKALAEGLLSLVSSAIAAKTGETLAIEEQCPVCLSAANCPFSPLEPDRLRCSCNSGFVERCAGTLRAVGRSISLSSVFRCQLCSSVGIIDGDGFEFGWSCWRRSAALCIYCSVVMEPVLIK